MLSELARKNKPNGGLDLPGGDCWLLVVASETRRFLSELLEDIVDEAVHDSHGLARDSDVRMNLLQDLEQVKFVRLDSLLRLLLLLQIARGRGILPNLLLRAGLLLGDGRGFLGGLLLSLGRHWREMCEVWKVCICLAGEN